MIAAQPGRLTNLPHSLTPFIGRQQEVADIRHLLSGRRLITLTGPGGSGKTRLALAVAGGLEAEFPDGAWLVELAELTEPGLVPQAVAAALGLREAPGRQAEIDLLTDFLHGRHILLLLDNCEHLLAACAHLATALLQSCPHLHLLTTSRQALGLPGEIVRPMLPLALPTSHGAFDLTTLSEVEAVALFLEQATALAPNFTLTEVNARAVVQICRLLEGMLLAIELAAARVPVLSVAQIAARLGDSLHLLAAGPRLGASRHQTMHTAIEWSYALLPEAEQKLWRRLSLFRGSFSLAAVEAVCPDRMTEQQGDVTLPSPQILDLLTHLVHKSLVVVVRGEGGVRYRLLEPLRQYAAEQLEAAGETPDFYRRHYDYYLAWAETHEAKLRGPEQVAWLAHFDARYANLRVALAWSLREPEDARLVLRLAATLSWYWVVRNMFAEGRHWLEAALTRPVAEMPTLARQHALMFAAIHAWFQADHPPARRYIEESYALVRSLEEDDGRWGIPYILMVLGQVVRFQGEEEAALRYLSESVAEARRRDDRWGMALAMNCFGSVCRQIGDYPAAYAAFYENRPIWYATGDLWGIAMNHLEFFWLAGIEGDHDTATAIYRETEAAFEALGLAWQLYYMTIDLGNMALQRGDYVGAADHYRHCAALVRQIGGQSREGAVLMGAGTAALGQGHTAEGIARCREGLLLLEKQQSHWYWAAGFLERLADVAARMGHIDPVDQLRAVSAALHAREEPAPLFARALTALQELTQPPTTPRQAPGTAASPYDLTPRELEVLRLAAEGLTDPQIADRLVISKRTVSAHLHTIYSKLGVTTRTAATRLAIERNLL